MLSARSRMVSRPKRGPRPDPPPARSNPCPSSLIVTTVPSPGCGAKRTVTVEARACLRTFVSASCTIRITCASTASGEGRGAAGPRRASRPPGAPRAAAPPRLPPQPLYILAQAGQQSLALRRGAEAENRLPHLLVGLLHRGAHLLQFLGGHRGVAASNQVRRHLGLQVDEPQHPPQAVVHLPRQAVPLLQDGQAAHLLKELFGALLHLPLEFAVPGLGRLRRLPGYVQRL